MRFDQPQRCILTKQWDELLQVRINNPRMEALIFTSGVIGGDNAIARHGIHGLYWLYTIDIQGSHVNAGGNIIYLTQASSTSPFQGIMYDYIRFEAPPQVDQKYIIQTA